MENAGGDIFVTILNHPYLPIIYIAVIWAFLLAGRVVSVLTEDDE